MKFNPVKINKTETCLTYVFKRVGKYDPLVNYTLDLYDEYFDSKIFEDNSHLKVGDVIMWTGQDRYENYPFEILENGVIITHNVLRGRHCAIIEQIIDKTQILYSECSRRNSDVGIPQLNMKNLLDVRTPDYVLTFKT